MLDVTLPNGFESRQLTRGFVIASKPMENIARIIKKIADIDVLVLIHGESGTGKELVAQAIHDLSRRNVKEMVTVYCPDLTSEIINSELFGHEKGSFTGATDMRIGMFEQASGGTIFIDEISELSLKDQARLLRVLEKNQIRRVGGRKDINVNIRVIAATNKKLENLVRTREFRPDLYFRLKRIEISVPPLRSRVEEIPVLADFFLREINSRNKSNISFTPRAIEKMKRQKWPGNVRELKNTIERSVLLADSNEIDELIIFEEIAETISDDYGEFHLDDVVKKRIEDALSKNSGIQKLAAKDLGISQRVINYKIKKFGINISRFKFTGRVAGRNFDSLETEGAEEQTPSMS